MGLMRNASQSTRSDVWPVSIERQNHRGGLPQTKRGPEEWQRRRNAYDRAPKTRHRQPMSPKSNSGS